MGWVDFVRSGAIVLLARAGTACRAPTEETGNCEKNASAMRAKHLQSRCVFTWAQAGMPVLLKGNGDALPVVRYSGEDLGGVRRICAAVPERESALHVICAGSELCGEDCAADREACGWIAECGEAFCCESVFARDLSHHLHQAPGN